MWRAVVKNVACAADLDAFGVLAQLLLAPSIATAVAALNVRHRS
jgi:hypothetical protein